LLAFEIKKYLVSQEDVTQRTKKTESSSSTRKNNGLESPLAYHLAANGMENGGGNSEDSLQRQSPPKLANQAELGRPKASPRFDLIAKPKPNLSQ
jgi:hypothetical protein